MKIIKSLSALFVLAVILACGAVGGSAPTQELPDLQPPEGALTSYPAGALTSSPTPIPPTSTATPIPPTPTPEVQQFFTENFPEEHSENWSYFLRNGSEDKFSITSTGDGLLFELTGTGIFSYLVYEPFEYEEVRMDVTVENLGVNDNNVTLFCRYSPEGGWYEFNVYSSGLYDMFFTKPDSAGNLNYGLIAEGGSNKIKMGQAINKYSMICTKDALTVFINDVETRSVGIPSYVLENGKVGVSVSSFGQIPVKVKVKEFQISQP